MKRILIIFILFMTAVIAGVLLRVVMRSGIKYTLTPVGTVSRPLDNYTIESLGKRSYIPSEIVFDQSIATAPAYTSYLFHYISDGKKITGLANIPDASQNRKVPVILQLRGYVDRESYETGTGTKRSGEVFAANGFLTLAPDFLGYAGSDMPSTDIFEERFQTYTATMNLISSLKYLPIADADNIFIWGHSNGGQIGLTTLEIYSEATRSSVMPVIRAGTFWAPVTRPFPYSILYYTDDAPDGGKLLRNKLAEFEKLYNTDLYSLTDYIGRISVPVQIHQGIADEAVPVRWSDDIVRLMDQAGLDISYYKYAGADHNMTGAWDTVVGRDIIFFRNHIR